MLPSVYACIVPFGGDAAHQFRMPLGLCADEEERRPYAPLPEQVQHTGRHLRVRSVVERQRDDPSRGPVAAQRADVRPQPYLVGAVEQDESRGDYDGGYIHVSSMADSVRPEKSL